MRKIFILGALTLALIACEKNDSINTTSVAAQPDNFHEIKNSPDFSWSTEKEFSLDLVALKNIPFTTTNFIEIRDLKGELVYKTLASTSDSKKIKFLAKGSLESAVVSFGTISKELSFTNNTAEFDFIAFDDRSDIQDEN